MAGIADSDLADLIATTTKNLPDLKFEIAQNYQNYEVMNRWFRDDREMVGSGYSVQRNVILDASGNARFVQAYQKSTVNVVDVFSQLEVPWRRIETQWSVERSEMMMNREPSKFVDLVQGRRAESAMGWADLMEQRGWQSPESSTDTLNPYGIPYWIPELAAGQAGEGFYGGSDTNVASTTGGIDPGTSGDNTTSITGGKSLWRSYSAGGTGYYTAVNETLLRTLQKAILKTGFKAPINLPKDLNEGMLSNYRLYCNADTYIGLGDLVRGQNDQVGADLFRYNGIIMFNRHPVIYVAYLDNDTYNPIYGVNHNKFFPVVMEGNWMYEHEPMNDRELRNVFTTFTDGQFNFICMNRRCQFVVNKTA